MQVPTPVGLVPMVAVHPVMLVEVVTAMDTGQVAMALEATARAVLRVAVKAVATRVAAWVAPKAAVGGWAAATANRARG